MPRRRFLRKDTTPSASATTTPARASRRNGRPSQEPFDLNRSYTAHSPSSPLNHSPKQPTLRDVLTLSTHSKPIKSAAHVIELLESSPEPDEIEAIPSDEPEILTPELPPADDLAPKLDDHSTRSRPNSPQHFSLEITAPHPETPSKEPISQSSPPPSAHSPVLHRESFQATIVTNRTSHESDEPIELEALLEPELKPKKDPLANQPLLFKPEDLQLQPLYDELKALLDTENASDDEDDDETYEQRRQRNLRANEALLAQLGLASQSSDPISAPGEDPAGPSEIRISSPAPKPGRSRGRPPKRESSPAFHDTEIETAARRTKKKPERRIKFAEDGTTTSAPNFGEVFTLAYVDVPVLRDRARSEYIFIKDVPDIDPADYETWSEPEELIEASDEDDELHMEEVDGKISTKKKKPKRVAGVSHGAPFIDSEGNEWSSCHQCRRKTADAKMRCQRVRDGVQCSLLFCYKCLSIRYGIEFDPESTGFECPKCSGYCNCSICLKRNGLGGLVTQGQHRIVSLSQEIKGHDGHLRYQNVKEYIEAIMSDPALKKRFLADTVQRLEAEKAAKRKDRRRSSTAVADGDGADSPTKQSKGKKRKSEAQNLDPVKKKRGRPPKTRVMIVADRDGTKQVDQARLEGGESNQEGATTNVASMDARTERKKLVIKFKSTKSASTTVKSPPNRSHKKESAFRDKEKDVWVRGAADYSTTDSEEFDELEDEGDDSIVGLGSQSLQPGTEPFGGIVERGLPPAEMMPQEESSRAAESDQSSALTSVDDDVDMDDNSDILPATHAGEMEDEDGNPYLTQQHNEAFTPSTDLGSTADFSGLQEMAIAALADSQMQAFRTQPSLASLDLSRSTALSTSGPTFTAFGTGQTENMPDSIDDQPQETKLQSQVDGNDAAVLEAFVHAEG